MVMSIGGTTGSAGLGAPGRDETASAGEAPPPDALPAPGEAAELQPAINKSPPTTSPAIARGDNGTCSSGPSLPGNLMDFDVIIGAEVRPHTTVAIARINCHVNGPGQQTVCAGLSALS
jgi:hypothetical protein